MRDESLLSLELGRPSAQHEERFYALPDAAKAAIEVGKLSEARAFAEELLELTSEFPDNWNYGNAIHDYQGAEPDDRWMATQGGGRRLAQS